MTQKQFNYDISTNKCDLLSTNESYTNGARYITGPKVCGSLSLDPAKINSKLNEANAVNGD